MGGAMRERSSSADDDGPGDGATATTRLRTSVLVGVALAGVVSAAVGAAAGAMSARPMYRAVAVIELVPDAADDDGATAPPAWWPMFDAYVESQVTLLTSPRVVDMTLARPALAALRRTADADGVAKFRASLSAERPVGGARIEVSFRDADPDVAVAVANEAIASYLELEEERAASGLKLREARARCVALGRGLEPGRGSAEEESEGVGVAAVERRHRAAVDELNAINVTLSELDLEIAAVQASGAAVSPRLTDARNDALARREAADGSVCRLERELRVFRERERETAELRAQISELDQALASVEGERPPYPPVSVSVVSAAVRPVSPESSDTTVRALIGGAAGLVLGLAAAWAVARGARSVRAYRRSLSRGTA